MVKTKGQRAETLEQAFGRTLIARRKEKRLSQMDLAVASGYSLRYIGDIERGAKSATMRTMHDLATLLDVRLGVLVVEAESLLDVHSDARARSGKPKFIRLGGADAGPSDRFSITPEGIVPTISVITLVRIRRWILWLVGKFRKRKPD